MTIFIRSFFVFALILLPSILLAQSTSEFTIRTMVGDDIIPPTTPTLLSVVPTAPTQIDVSWSVSTDNFMLGGYVLLRDGAAIATTSLTSFIDTGLTPETLYEYEVYAFDTNNNISTTSNALSTTTPAVPIVPPAPTSTPPEGGSSATIVFRLLGFDIALTTNSALFTWETSQPASYALRWGRSDAYSDGYIVNETYKANQRTIITDLLPGTTYFYELVGYAASGRVLELRSGQFTTQARENLAPANVQNFTATPTGNDVRLTYNAASLPPNAVVRIVSNHLGYPLDPYDGAVIYEGTAESFLDAGAFTSYSTMYYTAFVMAVDGSVSSGAIALARKPATPLPGDSTTTPTAPLVPILPDEPDLPIPNFSFSTGDIKVSQEGSAFTFESEQLNLLQSDAFIISIEKSALPDSLKSIIVTIINPQNQKQTYSFLLRINKEGDAYEAIIAPLLASGPSFIQVEIFDFERSVIGRYRKAVTFVEAGSVSNEVMFPDKLVQAAQPFFPFLAFSFLGLFALLLWLYRRSKIGEAEDKR